MAPRMKSWLKLAALCSLAAMFVGEREAQAGAISIKGKYMPGGGDPFYTYVFDVTLDAPTGPGTNTLESGDSFTVKDIPGVTTGSGSTGPPGLWTFPVITPTQMSPPIADVQWIYAGPNVSASNPATPQSPASVFLGEFTVTTTVNYPTGVTPFPPTGTGVLTYTYSYDGQTQTGSGQVTVSLQSVPEPSSALLLAAGTGVFPVLLLSKWRRRQREKVSR